MQNHSHRDRSGPDPCWWQSHRKASEAISILLQASAASDVGRDAGEGAEEAEEGGSTGGGTGPERHRNQHQRSIKSLTLANGVRNKPYVHLLVCETLRCLPALRAIYGSANTQPNHQQHCKQKGKKRRRAEDDDAGGVGSEGMDKETILAMVLLYALLFFRGGLKPVGKEEKAMLKRKNVFKASLARLMVRYGVDSVDKLCPKIDENAEAGIGGAGAELKTVRVNTLVVGVEDALKTIDVLRSERIEVSKPPSTSEKQLGGGGGGDVRGTSGVIDNGRDKLDEASTVTVDSVTSDRYVYGVFHIRGKRRVAGLHAHDAVATGKLVIQSWSSCLPAAALDPKRGWRVIDACAAPGNKTTQLAAMVGRSGHVYAFDRSSTRIETLRGTVTKMGAAEIVTAIHEDFLSTDPKDYADVKAMLLDPSCSGSGTMHKRGDILIQRAMIPLQRQGDPVDVGRWHAPTDPSQLVSSERRSSLAAVQLRLLLHALSFPSLKRLVYSTCSVFREENEAVIEGALEFATRHGWKIGHPFREWPRRGTGNDGEQECWLRKLVRVDPFLGDTSDGFFLCLFVRDGDADIVDSAAQHPAHADGNDDTAETKKQKQKKKKKKKKKKKMNEEE